MAKSQSAVPKTIDRRASTTQVAHGTRAILVGPHHLIEINMERVARAVDSGQSPPPVPRRPEKKDSSPTWSPLGERRWLTILDDFRTWLIRKAAC